LQILLVKLGALGDVLRTTPLLTALKRENPGATVHWSDTGRCWWWSDSPEPYRHHDDRRPRTSARAAMRAADAAKESR
jgi:hypothetical protein